jgi:hypothetical protein
MDVVRWDISLENAHRKAKARVRETTTRAKAKADMVRVKEKVAIREKVLVSGKVAAKAGSSKETAIIVGSSDTALQIVAAVVSTK